MKDARSFARRRQAYRQYGSHPQAGIAHGPGGGVRSQAVVLAIDAKRVRRPLGSVCPRRQRPHGHRCRRHGLDKEWIAAPEKSS